SAYQHRRPLTSTFFPYTTLFRSIVNLCWPKKYQNLHHQKMKKKLLIIGAGNVGGFLSYNIKEFSPEYEIVGFIDDDKRKIGNKIDRKSTRLNSSHVKISYAVFCL